MKAAHSLAGGLAGALVLTIIHEAIRQKADDAPRMDKLGKEALNKTLKAAGIKPLRGKKLYYTTMISDVISNALYYSLIGGGSKKNSWGRGIALGLAAGIGGVELPGPLGLTQKYSSRTAATSAMTIGYYLLGGLIATAAMNALQQED